MDDLPWMYTNVIEPVHEVSNNVVCVTSKASDQPAHTRSQTRDFAHRLNILWVLSYWRTSFGDAKLKRRLHMLVWVYTCQNVKSLKNLMPQLKIDLPPMGTLFDTQMCLACNEPVKLELYICDICWKRLHCSNG